MIEKPKHYEEVLTEYNKLSLKKKVSILNGAIEYMNQYNGRTRSDCIFLAMGYVNTGEENIFIKKGEKCQRMKI